jgi:hypothetical protein
MNKQRVLNTLDHTMFSAEHSHNLCVQLKNLKISTFVYYRSDLEVQLAINIASNTTFSLPDRIKGKNLKCDCSSYAHTTGPVNRNRPYHGTFYVNTLHMSASYANTTFLKIAHMLLTLPYGSKPKDAITCIKHFIETY